MFACSRRILPSPAEAGFKPPHFIAWSGTRTTAVFARGVLCTFWPQKVPKTPRQMPAPTSSRLTFARLKGGFKGRWAAERVISDTTLSLLKPASYACTFSRDFVSRLGIGPGSFAAKRGGRDASGTSRKHRSLRSPLEAGFNRRILACSGTRTTDSPRARSGRLAKASAGEGRQRAVCRAATA